MSYWSGAIEDLQAERDELKAALAALREERDKLLDRANSGYYGRKWGRVVAEKNELGRQLLEAQQAHGALREERDAFKEEANALRRNYVRETKELAQTADKAEAALAAAQQAHGALRELIATWRAQAKHYDRESATANGGSYHNTAVARRRTYTICADGLEAVLAAAAAPAQGEPLK